MLSEAIQTFWLCSCLAFPAFKSFALNSRTGVQLISDRSALAVSKASVSPSNTLGRHVTDITQSSWPCSSASSAVAMRAMPFRATHGGAGGAARRANSGPNSAASSSMTGTTRTRHTLAVRSCDALASNSPGIRCRSTFSSPKSSSSVKAKSRTQSVCPKSDAHGSTTTGFITTESAASRLSMASVEHRNNLMPPSAPPTAKTKRCVPGRCRNARLRGSRFRGNVRPPAGTRYLGPSGSPLAPRPGLASLPGAEAGAGAGARSKRNNVTAQSCDAVARRRIPVRFPPATVRSARASRTGPSCAFCFETISHLCASGSTPRRCLPD